MPYSLKKLTGGKFAIVRKADGKTVGTSASKAKAIASIGYRMGAESGQNRKGHRVK